MEKRVVSLGYFKFVLACAEAERFHLVLVRAALTYQLVEAEEIGYVIYLVFELAS